MASPITWQNINGPDPKAAMMPMALASQTLSNAFSGIKDTFNEYQTGVKDRNTNAFLDALSQYNTPEAMQQAIDSGAIAQLKQQYGNMIHHDQVRNAPGEMLTQALSRAKALDERADYTAERNHRGAINDALISAANGDEKAITALANLEGVDVQKYLTTLQSALTSHTTRVNSRDSNSRANAQDKRQADEHSVRLAGQNLDLESKQEAARNTKRTRELEQFLDPYARQARDLLESGAITSETASEILRKAGRGAEEQNLGTSTEVNAMLEALQGTAGAAGRTYGIERAADAAKVEYDVAKVTQELQDNPLYGAATDIPSMLTAISQTLESKELIPRGGGFGWLNSGEANRLQQKIGENLHKRMEFTDDDGNKFFETIPLAAHQQAVLQAYDAIGPGDIEDKYLKALRSLTKSPEFLSYLKDLRKKQEQLLRFNMQKSLRGAVNK
jgi:hypothetical protein